MPTRALRFEKCPVCQTALGTRYFTELKELHCRDCRATFTFYPGCVVPKGLPDSQAPKKCNCASCRPN